MDPSHRFSSSAHEIRRPATCSRLYIRIVAIYHRSSLNVNGSDKINSFVPMTGSLTGPSLRENLAVNVFSSRSVTIVYISFTVPEVRTPIFAFITVRRYHQHRIPDVGLVERSIVSVDVVVQPRHPGIVVMRIFGVFWNSLLSLIFVHFSTNDGKIE